MISIQGVAALVSSPQAPALPVLVANVEVVMLAIVFYADADDVGTILSEGLTPETLPGEFERLERDYPNKGIDSGGILCVESW